MKLGNLQPFLKLALSIGAAIGPASPVGLCAGSWPPMAPPPPPPVAARDLPATPSSDGLHAAGGSVLYSIGEPTDEEQLYLEYINRARANPPTEGLWLAGLTDPDVLNNYAYFGVNTSALVWQFSTNASVSPLSFSSNLIASARRHTADMLAHAYQGHTGSDGSTVSTRLADAGYVWSSYGENVYSYAQSVLHGHAGFNADWGVGPDGMQSPPGHRLNILSSYFREIGIGVMVGSNSVTNGSMVTSVGPQLVTQDFGSRPGLTPILTGVAYFDFNGNGFYDLGEGIGGVRVSAAGSSSYAVTAVSGGFSMPVPGNGNYPVDFSAGGLTLKQQVVTVSGGNSAKVDFTPAYDPPTVSGPPQPFIGWSNAYTFTAVTAATNYLWRSVKLTPYSLLDGAEYGTTNMIITGSGNYPKITNTVKYAGSYSFHLAHPAPPSPQAMEINRLLLPGTNAQVRFASRLGWATPDQVARLQISTDGGNEWIDLWSQAGTSSAGETSFRLRTNSLFQFAGQEIRLRFFYDFTAGSYYSDTDTGVGWYLDEIALTGVEEMGQPMTNAVNSAAGFLFMPTDGSRYQLAVRAQLPGRILPFGPSLTVTGTAAPPALQIVLVDPNVVLYWPTNPAGFVLQATPDWMLQGNWTNVPAVPTIRGTNYELSVSRGSPTLFYRLQKP